MKYRVPVRVDIELYEKLKAYAEAMRQPLANVLRDAIAKLEDKLSREIMETYKIDEVVWYMGENDISRQQAVVVALDGSTQLRIRLLTGPEQGKEFVAPIGVVSKKDDK